MSDQINKILEEYKKSDQNIEDFIENNVLKDNEKNHVVDIFKKNSLDTLIYNIFPQKRVFSIPVYLSLFNYSRLLDNDTKIQYDLTTNKLPNSISTTVPVQNVIGFKVHPFFLYTTTVILKNGMNLFIEEFAGHSVVTKNNTNYHISSTISITTNTVGSYGDFAYLYHPKQKYIQFRSPVQSLSTITISFMSFDPFINNIPIKYEWLLRIYHMTNVVVTPDIILFQSRRVSFYQLPPYGSNNFFIVNIKNFKANDPVIDKEFIDYVNREEGHRCHIRGFFGTGGNARIVNENNLTLVSGIKNTEDDPIIVNISDNEFVIPIELFCYENI